MPPIGQADVSSLSDEQLSDMLREYGVDVGPVNVATRRTYERYLIRLRTGAASPPSHHAPVDDDEDDDEEVILKYPSQEYHSPPPSQPRQRQVQESHIPTPRGDSLGRPPLGSARKTTSTPFTPSSRPTQSAPGPRQQQQQPEASGGGIPTWVKLSALLVVLVLVYLIYSNMEPGAVSKIPAIPNKVEV